MRYTMLALACVALVACTERALAPPEDVDGGARDLAVNDLAQPDLTVVDLALADRPKPNPCPAGTEFIYTIQDDGMLSRFNPVSNQFFDVAHIHCPTKLNGTPNSMAISREGKGWVNYSSGELFELNPQSAACLGTSYAPAQDGLVSFGMSFAQDTPGGPDESLYVADSTMGQSQTRFGRIDLTTYTLGATHPIAGTQPELTGDDEANLWGFFPSDEPPRIARIDKDTGALDRITTLPSLIGLPSAWGVAHYQGDFYVFLQHGFESSSSIYRVNEATGSIATVVSNSGRRIVGVGVATCAGDGLDGP